MEIRCRHCGEYFCPSDECVDLISEGYISSDSVNICDDLIINIVPHNPRRILDT